MPSTASVHRSPLPAGRTARSPTAALAAGIAILVVSEFLPASVLPSLAAGLGVRTGTAGLAMAATAIAGALTAPSIAVVLPRTDRRTVLVALLVMGAVSNFAVAVSPGFLVLLLARLLLGVAIAGYWAFAFGAGTYALRGREHAVSAGLGFGVSVATVLGVPSGSLVGDHIGWRTAFAGAGGLAALGAVGLAVALPRVPAQPSAGWPMMRQAIVQRRLMAGIGCVGLVAIGNFMAYPYIRMAIARVEPGGTTSVLVIWGLGGAVGTLVAGGLARWLRSVAAVTPLLLGVGLLLSVTARSLPVLILGIFVWGLAFNTVPVFTQLWVTRVDPERAESAVSLMVTAFQLAVSLGAAAGGALVVHYGVRAPVISGAAFAAAAGLGWSLLRLPPAD